MNASSKTGPTNEHPAIGLAAELIQRASITPDDAGCQAIIGERLRKAGFSVESMPFGEVSNLWATFGTKGPTFCLAGHTDVVPPGPLGDWRYPPFEASVAGELLYGRGAADMKSSLAAMIVAAERFTSTNPSAGGRLAFLITSDEEGIAIDGTKRVIETLDRRGEKIDWCLIGEPSSATLLGDRIRIGRRGSLTGKLTVHGTQGHVAYPELASNPIHSVTPFLQALCAKVWDAGNAHFPATSMQVVGIQSGLGVSNVIPGVLQAEFNFRYSTEWTSERLQQAVEALCQQHDLDFELDWHLSGEPFLTAPGEFSNIVEESIQAVAGHRPELSTGGGTSDGRFISPAGAEVIELGPVGASIHKTDEHIRMTDIIRLCDIYYRIIARLLS